jgi:hypothetical protein
MATIRDPDGYGYVNSNIQFSIGTPTATANGNGDCFIPMRSELEILRDQVREFYNWLKQKAKNMEDENPDSVQCIDAILDKMEEEFPEAQPDMVEHY